MMRRTTCVLAAALAFSAAGSASAAKPKAATMKGKEIITCPIMKSKVAKAKAIAVKTKSGKTVYVCCKSCVNAAKQLK